MIGLLDQNVSPNPWAQQQQRDQQQQQQQQSSSSSSSAATSNGHIIPKLSPQIKTLDAMDEEVEDEEIQLPLRDEDNHDEYEYPSQPMDLDDEIIIDCDNPKIQEIRHRKRTISMKLKETVEAFRRMNGMGHYGHGAGGGSSSSSGGEISTTSPNHRNPKLSNKMSSTESGVECNGDLLPDGSRRESLSVYAAEARSRPRRQTICNKVRLDYFFAFLKSSYNPKTSKRKLKKFIFWCYYLLR